ncbi:MAG: bifunctional precorrin-2 dehydrogenase/sirohydrochlorin ferrochelatase [Desulfovibrionaceae bacterium]|nr:bifunctional precorrin-2 dehydrogenase/sirohydrochlorin ferrochelatase [Desulfovibrionaceae bacterium]
METRFPINLSLQGKRCLIAGLGKVGQRKLSRLLRYGADATFLLFDPFLPGPPDCTRGHPSCVFNRRTVEEQDCIGADLVFACTADPKENARIAALCKKHHVHCNSASNPEDGDFSLPALCTCGDMSLCLSTNGASPALAKKWRKELEAWAEEKKPMLTFMARLRPLVLSLGRPSADNTLLFTRLADSPLESWLQRGETDKAATFLLPLLPAELQNALPELLYDLV